MTNCSPTLETGQELTSFSAPYMISDKQRYAGASIPQQPWRAPQFSRLPLFCHPIPHAHPRKQFLAILCAILCNFMHVFSEFCKLAVGDNNTKNIG